MRRAQSFNEDEVAVIYELFSKLFSGQDPRILMRRKEFLSVFRKFSQMRDLMLEQKKAA